MIDVMDPLCDAWFTLLNREVSYGGNPVNVYPGDPANDDYNHHIVIRAESSSDESNKSTFVTNAVIVLDIVTVHETSINKSIVNDIKGQVSQLIFPTRKPALPALTNLQVTNISLTNTSYLEEDDGTRKYHRCEMRFSHRITQTNL